MNLDPSEIKLENLLRGLVPDAPSPLLMQRIEEELKLDMSWLNATARPRRQVTWLSSAGWSALGAAAAVAVMSFLPAQPSGSFPGGSATLAANTPTAPEVVIPVSKTIREWDDTQEGARRQPEQYVHVSSRDRDKHGWINPRDGARITLEYAEVEKLALPVNFLSEAPFPLRDLPLYQP